jgi:deazaflavin-dependent oxidoreductase (nitroreductase family)
VSGANAFNNKIIEEFRANDGRVGGDFEGAPMLLLTVTGAKTGRRITSPLVYTRDEDRIVVIASNGGADKHPTWFGNLVAHPIVTVELGTETFEAKAHVTDGAERDRLFAAQAEMMPGFWDYQKNTSRVIPVVALERLS